MSLDTVVVLYRTLLTPLSRGPTVTPIDLAAALRLCVALRQIRDQLRARHPAHAPPHPFPRVLATTLTVVYAGEAITAPLLAVPPSFILSPLGPALITAVQALVHLLPAVPPPSIHTELPLSLLDALTRALLLCTLIPPLVTANPSPLVASSPWSLLITSLITANAGFFLANLLSLLHPTPIALTTPPELAPNGWTATDLWSAPLITGLYALLTHAQPYWAHLHAVLAPADGKQPAPWDPETARAACALVLATLFTARTLKNFAYTSKSPLPVSIRDSRALSETRDDSKKIKTQ